MNSLSPDKPVENPKNDMLGYASFSKHLASGIIDLSPKSGLVIALNGPWGSGKTSIINFVEYFLGKSKENTRPIIVKFNPWWFNGEESLIQNFFYSLRKGFEKSNLDKEKQKENIINLMLLASTTIPDKLTVGKWSASFPGQAIRWFIGLFQKKQLSVEELKSEISNSLLKSKKKILVIIDDIDRLSAEEIRQLFRLVKNVADFPNVVYLLSFDKKAVIESLKRVQDGISGEEYLEKIIQVPFDIPLPEKNLLYSLFFSYLNSIFKDEKEYDKLRWQGIFFDGIEKFLKTPRSILRLYNSLRMTFPVVRGEVDQVDLIAIDAIRIFSPFCYRIIKNNPKEFTGEVPTYSQDGEDQKQIVKFHQTWYELLKKENEEESKIISSVLPVLFPKTKLFFKSYLSEPNSEIEWRLNKRICHPDKFPIYFSLTVPSDSVSSIEIENLVSISSNQKEFEQKLLEYSKQKLSTGMSKVRGVLDWFRDYTFERIPKENIPVIIRTILNIGDKLLLPNDEGHDMFDFGNSDRMGRIVWPLLKRGTKDENFNNLSDGIINGKSLSTIVKEVSVLGQQHGKNGGKKTIDESELLVSFEDLAKLEQLALIKIRENAKNGNLIKVPTIVGVLYRWIDWSGSDNEVKEWVSSISKSESGLITFITKFLAKNRSYGSNGMKITYRLDPKGLSKFIDLEKTISRVVKIVEKGNLHGDDKIALERLLKEYEMRKAGKDPDSFFSD